MFPFITIGFSGGGFMWVQQHLINLLGKTQLPIPIFQAVSLRCFRLWCSTLPKLMRSLCLGNWLYWRRASSMRIWNQISHGQIRITNIMSSLLQNNAQKKEWRKSIEQLPYPQSLEGNPLGNLNPHQFGSKTSQPSPLSQVTKRSMSRFPTGQKMVPSKLASGIICSWEPVWHSG